MLDPTRLKLGAESVGYQIRCGRSVDWDSFKTALQTDYNNQGSAVQVRREADTPVNEIHSMGAQISGQEGNSLILTNQRQARQINGYPLRHFDAQNPAIILPVKYGGLPLYNPKQVASQQYVSRFTEPLSSQLDSSTELLSRQGMPALTSDIARPYQKHFFMNPLTSTKNELEANQSVFKQRMHLQHMKGKGRYVPIDTLGRNFFQKASQNIIRGANGVPYAQNRDAIISENMEANGGFAASLNSHFRRAANNQNHIPELESEMYMPYSDGIASIASGYGGGSETSFQSSISPENVVGIDDLDIDLPAFLRDYDDGSEVVGNLIKSMTPGKKVAVNQDLADRFMNKVLKNQSKYSQQGGIQDPEFESSPSSGYRTPQNAPIRRLTVSPFNTGDKFRQKMFKTPKPKKASQSQQNLILPARTRLQMSKI